MTEAAPWVHYLIAPRQDVDDCEQDPYGVRPVNSSEKQAQAKTNAEKAAESALAWIAQSEKQKRGRLAIVMSKFAAALLEASGLAFSLLQDAAEFAIPKCYELLVDLEPESLSVDWEANYSASLESARDKFNELCRLFPCLLNERADAEAEKFMTKKVLLQVAVDGMRSIATAASPEVAHAILISSFNSRPGSIITLLGHSLRRHSKDRAKYSTAAVGVLLNAYRKEALAKMSFLRWGVRFLEAQGEDVGESQTDDPHSVGSLSILTLIVELLACAAPRVHWNEPPAEWEKYVETLFRMFIAVSPQKSLMQIALATVNVVTPLDEGLGTLDTPPITYARVFNFVFLYDRLRRKTSPALIPKCYSARVLFLALIKCTYVVLKYDLNQEVNKTRDQPIRPDILGEVIPVLNIALQDYPPHLPPSCFNAADTFVIDFGEWLALVIYGTTQFELRGGRESIKDMRPNIMNLMKRFVDPKVFGSIMSVAETILTKLPDIPCRDGSVAFLAKLNRTCFVQSYQK